MGEADEVSVTVDTEDRVLQADDPKEESTDRATTTGVVVEEDGEIIVESAAEVQGLSPRVLFLNEDANSLIAIPAIPLE